MYFTEQGESLTELLKLVKQKYGSDVQIVEQKSLPKRGFSGMFGNKYHEVTVFRPDSDSDAKDRSPNAATLQAAVQEIRAEANAEAGHTELIRKFRQLDKKIDKIGRLLQKQSSVGSEELYPALRSVKETLIENDFSYQCIAHIVQSANRSCTIEQMQQESQFHQQILNWIADQINVASWDQIHNTRIHILIGPTGVGKTTTLAKIAKLLAYGEGTKRIASIGLFTIDNYRLAALEQLEGYGRSMKATVKQIRTPDELKAELAVHEQDDHILIDTIGRSPHESGNLGQMRDMLRNCGKSATYSLVISATTKYSDLELIKKQYSVFDYQSVIVTKLDEIDSVGNVISAFANHKMPFVYYTNGQKVPLDICVASKKLLLDKIYGFNIQTNSVL